jgi:hypothetical protein
LAEQQALDAVDVPYPLVRQAGAHAKGGDGWTLRLQQTAVWLALLPGLDDCRPDREWYASNRKELETGFRHGEVVVGRQPISIRMRSGRQIAEEARWWLVPFWAIPLRIIEISYRCQIYRIVLQF